MESNLEIIQDIIEQVINQKRIERWEQALSPDFVSHGAPFIGVGYSTDSTGDQHIIDFVLPGSPAEGVLQVGDELLWVADAYQRWETYEEIKQGISHAHRGSQYSVGVRRGDQTLEFEFTRDLIPGFETRVDQSVSELREFMTETFPDLKARIVQIFEVGDMVISLLEYRGTHAAFEREAIWREAWFARFSEGLIVEDWTVYDGSAYFRQLGYRLTPPDA